MRVCEPFTENDIIWPPDRILEGCTGADTDPSVTGEPILNDDNCSNAAVTYEDELFEIVPDACLKILRTWYVIDWCQAGSGNQWQWSHTQIR